MEVKQYDKRPLTVEAFKFDADVAEVLTIGQPNPYEFTIGQVRLKRIRSLYATRYAVWNPGKLPGGDPWQDVKHGDYVIIAPTGCRYPVQADQFERNYAERAPEAVE